MRYGVVRFPGSNCDDDCYHVTSRVMKGPTDMLWYKSRPELGDYDCIILPGGFSYGDYLRAGAIARFSPIMDSIVDYADKGGLVLGICNGFQILLEAGLLPGAMKINNNLKFVCEYLQLKVVNPETPFSNSCRQGQLLEIPVAHREGNYYIDDQGLEALRANNQIVLRYLDEQENPNGSIDNIAGICNRRGNVFGLMPHPERAAEALLGTGSRDGLEIFKSIQHYLSQRGERIG